MSDSSASSFMSASSDLPSQWWDTEHKTTSVLFKDALLDNISVLCNWVCGTWDRIKQRVTPVQGAASTAGIAHGPAGQIGSIGQWNQAKAKKILIGAIIFLVTGGIITTIIIFALRLRENNDYAAYGTYVDGSTENGEPSVQDW